LRRNGYVYGEGIYGEGIYGDVYGDVYVNFVLVAS
jgi:hypothetical protein